MNVPTRYYIEIVPEQADMLFLNGRFFYRVTGQSYFESKIITSAKFRGQINSNGRERPLHKQIRFGIQQFQRVDGAQLFHEKLF